MSSFDSKWGYIPEEISQKNSFKIVMTAQLITSICILLALQPPFVSFTYNDDIKKTSPSFLLIIIVSVLCVCVSVYMGDGLNVMYNPFKTNKLK